MNATYSRKNRNEYEIIATMLQIAWGGATKTQIMYGSNLSYELLIKYLQTLARSGFIEIEKEKRLYKTTNKGMSYLKVFRDLKRMRY